MDILKLLTSALRRVTTAISMPFRMLIVRIQKMFNINIITAKLVKPLTKNVKKLLSLRPGDKSEYVSVGPLWVFKKLFFALILALCAGIFLYFSMFAGKVEPAPTVLTGVKTDITYDYDDISIKGFSGLANIRSYDGKIVYTGEIVNGVCKGAGVVYSREGALLYEGEFDQNKYNGQGIGYFPGGGVHYQGQYQDNLFNGAGKQYSVNGTLLYDGEFKNNNYEGQGKLYQDNGELFYEGRFSGGKMHGSGSQYYSDGMLHYTGEFFEGVFQGQGSLYAANGQLLYTGVMHGGKINYKSLVGANLADVDSAFSETPCIYYYEDGNSCFYYEKAGVVITTDCRVKLYEWDRETNDVSDGMYFPPGDSVYSPTVPSSQEDTAVQTVSTRVANMPKAAFMSWEPINPYDPEDEEDDESSSETAEEEAARREEEQKQLLDAIQNMLPSESSAAPIAPPSDSASQNASQPSSSMDPNSGLPDFVEKKKLLYFEVDKDVWQSEEELERDKVFVKRVTVLDGEILLTGVSALDDDAPPSMEDCIAIESVRRETPIAFKDVGYEMDQQNKLFKRIWNINYANRIIRKSYISGNITYKLCYQTEEASAPSYYSIEVQ